MEMAMRRFSASAISVVLILVVAGLSPACVAGWTPAARVGRAAQDRCAEKKSVGKSQTLASATKQPDCGHAVTAAAARCGLRSFIQLQFAQTRQAELARPLLLATEAVLSSPIAVFIVSTGSPQSDRGPPRS